jgi:hypothetical protein
MMMAKAFSQCVTRNIQGWMTRLLLSRMANPQNVAAVLRHMQHAPQGIDFMPKRH